MGTHGPRPAAQEPPRLSEGARRRSDLYGRRAGRPLSAKQTCLVEELLPKIAVPTGAVDLEALFPSAEDFALEVGFGGGEHLATQARLHPRTAFIGCEPFLNGVAKLLTQIEAQAIANIRVHNDDARDVLSRLPDATLSRVFVLFPDPWPKLRHHKRRFIQTAVLDELARVMRVGAELRLASDHMEYARWSLALMMRHGGFRWTAEGAQDWRARGPDWPATRYEEKALKARRVCVYLRFIRT